MLCIFYIIKQKNILLKQFCGIKKQRDQRRNNWERKTNLKQKEKK